eukprot:SAG25_NODE_3064_length_1237_cov_1.207381_2_plen_80_part_00
MCHRAQIRLQTHMLHKLCLVNDYDIVEEVQGASGNIDDADDDMDDHTGCKWILQEKYIEEELEEMFQNGDVMPSGRIMT